jgi:hypothetical protein
MLGITFDRDILWDQEKKVDLHLICLFRSFLTIFRVEKKTAQ